MAGCVPLLPGQVIGTAGGSLKGAGDSWAANADVARVGRAGEVATGRLLNELAARLGGPTVFHDLVVPGSVANLDHVVVSGTAVTVVDTKSWRPGRYWSLGGRTRRGFERFTYADPSKVSLSWMGERVAPLLPKKGRVARPVLLVWPSNDSGGMSLRALRVPGTKVVYAAARGELTADRLGRLVGDKSADPSVVAALVGLLPGGGPAAVDAGTDGDFLGDEAAASAASVPFELPPAGDSNGLPDTNELT